ncbi:MAG: hypothetical protein K2M48_03780 [Clostridiales bacterium]|nr:hypothetical protein [Clostridiales bacterium]
MSSELYAFLFSLGLGIAARILYIGASALAKRTGLLPVTVVLDILVALTVGGALVLYIILTGTVIAPYIFACLFVGYLITYWLTRKRKPSDKKQPAKEQPESK